MSPFFAATAVLCHALFVFALLMNEGDNQNKSIRSAAQAKLQAKVTTIQTQDLYEQPRSSAWSSASPPRMSQVIVRAIKESDKAAWLSMWEAYNTFYKRTIPQNVTDTTFSRFLDSNIRIYGAVAVAEDKPIGFAHWYPHASTSTIEDQVYLHDLFVDPKTRNGGVGRKLIEHVAAYAREIDSPKLYWHTQHFNHAAQLLYVKVADKTDFVQYSVNPLKSGK
jgi:D-amino-acid N-acetyltransferase